MNADKTKINIETNMEKTVLCFPIFIRVYLRLSAAKCCFSDF